MAERVRVREIDDDEGRRLLRIIRRSIGSVVTWRRAQTPEAGDLHPPPRGPAPVRHLPTGQRQALRPHDKTKNRSKFLEFCRYLRTLYPPTVRLAVVCDNYSPHLTTKQQGSMIRRYTIWRNDHAADKRLRKIIGRVNVA
jgi:hypothetical protein